MIDANPNLDGDQVFTFISIPLTTPAINGVVWQTTAANASRRSCLDDGDATPEMQITCRIPTTVGDFIL
jgi:hypothetical protein